MLNLKPLPPNFDSENRALVNPLIRNKMLQKEDSGDVGESSIVLACMMLYYIEKISGMQPFEIKKNRQFSQKKGSDMYKKLSTDKKTALETDARVFGALKGV